MADRAIYQAELGSLNALVVMDGADYGIVADA
jgi:hypothetical protein